MIKTQELVNNLFSWHEVRLQANDLHRAEPIQYSIRAHSWAPYRSGASFVSGVESWMDMGWLDAMTTLLLYLNRYDG